MDVDKGEYLSIMGASGSGKSTLLNILGILDNYDTGEYFLDNILIKDLSETRAAALRNEKIGFIFQSFNLISFKNAMENVALPLYYQGVGRKKRNELALEYLDKMGLRSHAGHLPNEMSGGQKQRVAIARALIARPQIILADEPTGALDSQTSGEVMQILKDVNVNDGITMIIVTHEREVAESTNRIIHIKDGIICDNEYPQEKLKEEASLVINTNQATENLSIELNGSRDDKTISPELLLPEQSDAEKGKESNMPKWISSNRIELDPLKKGIPKKDNPSEENPSQKNSDDNKHKPNSGKRWDYI